MTTISFIDVGFTGTLTEDLQYITLTTALGQYDRNNNSITNLMPFVKCRDFYSDIIYVQRTRQEKPVHIYRFAWSFDPYVERLRRSRKYMYLLVKFEDKKQKATLLGNIYLLNLVEDEMGLRPTQVYDTDKDYVKVFKCDSKLLRISILINFYLLLLRVFSFNYKFKEGSAYDLLKDFGDQYLKVSAAHMKYRDIVQTDEKLAEELWEDFGDLRYDPGDMNKIRVITQDEKLFRVFLNKLNGWLNEDLVPLKDLQNTPLGTIHRESCVYSFFSDINNGGISWPRFFRPLANRFFELAEK